MAFAAPDHHSTAAEGERAQLGNRLATPGSILLFPIIDIHGLVRSQYNRGTCCIRVLILQHVFFEKSSSKSMTVSCPRSDHQRIIVTDNAARLSKLPTANTFQTPSPGPDHSASHMFQSNPLWRTKAQSAWDVVVVGRSTKQKIHRAPTRSTSVQCPDWHEQVFTDVIHTEQLNHACGAAAATSPISKSKSTTVVRQTRAIMSAERVGMDTSKTEPKDTLYTTILEMRCRENNWTGSPNCMILSSMSAAFRCFRSRFALVTM